jgi:hypothetical protein
MSALTRKRVHDQPETWHIHFAGVRVGMIANRSGVGSATQKWEWLVGFYPGGTGQHQHGAADSFEAARAAFETAWNNYLPTCTEADFQAWRDHRAWTEEKYRRFDRGERMPHDWRPHG